MQFSNCFHPSNPSNPFCSMVFFQHFPHPSHPTHLECWPSERYLLPLAPPTEEATQDIGSSEARKKWHQQQIDRGAKFLVLYTSFPTKICPKISKIRIMNVWIKMTLRNQKCTLHLRNWFFFNAEVHGTHNPSPGCHLFGTVRNQGGTTRCLDNSLMHHQSSLRSPFASNCHLQGNQHNPKLTGKSCC